MGILANAWSNSFAYDGKMRCRIEQDYSWNAGTSGWQQTNEVHFIYDGNVVVEERNASNEPLVSYTRGNDLSGTLQSAGSIGGLLARTTYGQELPGAPTTAFYHADGNGNITTLVYPNQQLAAKYLYDPFGNSLAMSGPLENFNKYRFSSKESDDNSGLYYYGYRFYDASLQRWVNRDPISEKGFYTLSRQRAIQLTATSYRFVNNDPILNEDAEGLWHICCRPVRGLFGESLFTHCDVRDRPCDSDPGGSSYPISRDCHCNNPAIKSDADMDKCLLHNPSGWGHTCWGDNCQSSSMGVLKQCCAQAPGWTPSWYAYPPQITPPPNDPNGLPFPPFL